MRWLYQNIPERLGPSVFVTAQVLATFKDEKQAPIIRQKHNHEHLTAPDLRNSMDTTTLSVQAFNALFFTTKMFFFCSRTSLQSNQHQTCCKHQFG